MRSRSVIPVGGVRQDDYPPPEWVDAIDRAAGVADWQLAAFERLGVALKWLRVWDPIAADLTITLCVRGRAAVILGRGVRHMSLENVSMAAPFEGDAKKAQEWLSRSWSLLSILLATPANLRAAIEANAVDRRALEWVRKHVPDGIAE